MAKRRRTARLLEELSTQATVWAGSSLGFGLAVATIVVWLLLGPFIGYSDTWQLAINTGTTIVTFLMVFLLQRAQNRESKVLQLKLSEIVAALDGASNRLIDLDSLTEQEIEALHRHYARLAELAAQERDRLGSHSIDEAERRHSEKRAARGARRPGATRSAAKTG